MIKRVSVNLIKTIFLLAEKLQGKYFFDFNNFSLPKEPTLFLCNHQMNFDAVRLRVHINKPISFVAHDEFFKNKFTKWISIHFLDLICRGKNKNDISFIRNIIKAKNNQKNIGIFPEGGINYFNHSIVINESLSKLCKKLNMPIVVLNVCGGSFVYPRYAKHKGKNKVEYKIKNIYYPDFYKNLSATELHSILKKDLFVNDYNWQKNILSKVNRKCPTKYLYKNLFVCPNCNNMHSLKFDKNNKIECVKCKHNFSINIYDFIEGASNVHDFVEWDKLQYLTLKKYLPSISNSNLLLIDKSRISYTKKTTYFKR
ncbi:MAG: 1-acyl-sn-glycerol-3-phosphate acyltransferase, partial [Clostridia bacterium]|nr:1-acyl-sn-glycerol-3-phosphate acyltransferase [Clostridia bacterium]